MDGGETNVCLPEEINLNHPSTPNFNLTHAATAHSFIQMVDDVGIKNPSENLSFADSTPKLSKKQMKRLKKKEIWLANLPAKRAKERLKLKMKRQVARQNNVSLGPTRRELKNVKMANSSCQIKLALDFSFDHLMGQKDIAKCIKQVQRCYSNNRRVANPLQFYIVNLNGKSREEMNKLTGYENWDVNIHHEEYLKLFSKEELVYLSSESDHVIETLEENNIYIIGALVDHNAHKGLCLRVAEAQGIKHGRLPIGEHLDMKSRKVLAINHVFEIILHVCNGMTWTDAMLKVLPQRKAAVAKNDDSDGKY